MNVGKRFWTILELKTLFYKKFQVLLVISFMKKTSRIMRKGLIIGFKNFYFTFMGELLTY